jgi:hypothetical protein
MGAVLGYARVSTGDQHVAGQTMRLEQAGAIKVFTEPAEWPAAQMSVAGGAGFQTAFEKE